MDCEIFAKEKKERVAFHTHPTLMHCLSETYIVYSSADFFLIIRVVNFANHYVGIILYSW